MPAPTDMDAIADLAETFLADEIRVAHEQNLVLPHVAYDDLPAVYDRLVSHGLATANTGLVTDIISCPGLDYCALATARSIPIAQRISERFGDGARAQDIGELKINISGCINACGHHHVGHIGILGLEKTGAEAYQITLGGSADETCDVGAITGRGFSSEEIVDAIETVVDTYLKFRTDPKRRFSRGLPADWDGAVQGGALWPGMRLPSFGDTDQAAQLAAKFAETDTPGSAARCHRGSFSWPDRARLEFWRRFCRASSHGRANRQSDARVVHRHQGSVRGNTCLS